MGIKKSQNLERLRICYICNEHPLIGKCGGIGTLTDYMAKSMINLGHDVLIVGVYKSIKKKIIVERVNLKIIALPYWRAPKIHFEFNRKRLMKLIEKENKRATISILEAPDYQGWLRKVEIDAPRVVRLHTPEKVGFDDTIDPNNLSRMLRSEQKAIQYADFVVSSSESVGKAAQSTYLKIADKLTNMPNIYNGLDTDLFSPSNEIKIQSGLVAFAGRLTAKKGIYDLIEAWSGVVQSNPSAKLLIAGNDSRENNFSVKHTLEKRIEELGISQNVKFLGFLDQADMIGLMRSAELCVFPSYREAFSAVIMEAMSIGKAVIYSKIPPGKEIITHGENGLLVRPGDISELEKGILKILNDNTFRRKLEINARSSIIERFDINTISKINLNFYQDCLSLKSIQ